ncbi:MAG: FG-GAP-like repeat-containing protein [Limisphaerales bacterium]
MKPQPVPIPRAPRPFGAFTSTIVGALLGLNTVCLNANCLPPAAGLVGWWKGESDASDSLVANPGTMGVGVEITTGHVGNGFWHAPNSAGIRIPASPALNVGTGSGLTIEGWIKPLNLMASPLVEWKNAGTNSLGAHFWMGGFSGPGTLYANLVDSSGVFHYLQSPGGIVQSNVWQHVAVTYDRSNGVARLYHNGTMVRQQTLGSFTPRTTYDLYLGRRPEPGTDVNSYHGGLDEISLYNRALTSNELAAIYAAGSAGKCSPTNPPPPVGPTILAGPVTNTANGSVYFLLANSTWTEAQAKAVQLGGHLVTVNDAAENAWLVDTFSNFGGQPRSLWIGFNDAAQEGNWVWVSGQPVGFTNWRPGEPNDGNGSGEDYAYIYGPIAGQPGLLGRWNDGPNTAFLLDEPPLHGVVEITATNPPPPPPPPPASGAPVIADFQPRVGKPGDLVEIHGANFSPTLGNNIVWFGAVRATVMAASVSNLVVQVPPGATYAGPSVTVGGLTGEAALPFLPTFAGGLALQGEQFLSQDFLTAPDSLRTASFSDLNADGSPDLIMSPEFGSANFVIQENRGVATSGLLDLADAFAVPTRGSGTFGYATDLDNDGYPDLLGVTRGPGGNLTVAVRRNRGLAGTLEPGRFEPTVSFPIGAMTEKVIAADLDGDGRKELIVAAGLRVRIFGGRAELGSFTTNSVAPPFDLPLSSLPSDLVSGDFDGDGRSDLVVSVPSENCVLLFRNTATPGNLDAAAFSRSVVFNGTSESLAVADLNGDGRLDLILNSPSDSLLLLLNQSGTDIPDGALFGPPIQCFAGDGPRSVAVGDLNGDGLPDLAVGTSARGTVTVLLNQSHGGPIKSNSFAVAFELSTPQEMTFPFSPPVRVAIADANLDGRQDIVVWGRFPGVRLYLNLEPPQITAIAPVQLKLNEGCTAVFAAEASGSEPRFMQWSFAGTDLPGATNATLVLSNVTYAQAGSYTLTVSNLVGVATTNAVLLVNRAPIADVGATERLLISPNGVNAIAVLDGSTSRDPDGDALTFAWWRAGDTNPLATTVVATTTLPVGTNALTLRVFDGMAFGQLDFVVEVITTAQAVDRLASAVAGGADRPQPLLASLRAALAAIDRSQPLVAINQLEAFQNKVRAQVAPHDPELAAQLIAEAQAIMDALRGGAAAQPAAIEITRIVPGANGKPSLQIRGQAGRVHVVEASTNGILWEPVGIATSKGGDEFEFTDAAASGTGARFYRVFSPR